MTVQTDEGARKAITLKENFYMFTFPIPGDQCVGEVEINQAFESYFAATEE